MRILPPRASLPAAPIDRRHRPRPGAYSTYRPCLRWEFGFACAFCFLHEADLTEHGAARSGLWWIEHHVGQTHDDSLVDRYWNCFYSCRYCNEARRTARVVDERGRRLLHPCGVAWGEYFEVVEDRLSPTADPDAEYTHETYDLDDERKRVMRRDRHEALTSARRAILEIPGKIEQLLEIGERVAPADRVMLLDAAEELRGHVKGALLQVERYQVVPSDRDENCRCADPGECRLPRFLEEQAKLHGFEP